MPDCTNIIVEPVFAAEDGLTLSILLYLDEAKDFRERYKLELLQCVLTRSGARVDVVDRSRAIDDTLLRAYHEVWFFLTSRNADEQLTDAECFALRDWMDHGGGVLITGDHADVNANGKFVGLGRPIGARIPRARHMREWDAAPGVRRDLGSINTTEISAGRDIAPQLLEQDATPQRLLLPTEVDGEPHAIFLDAQGRLLDRLPDHRHEGKVLDTVKKPVGEPEIPAHIDEWQGSDLKVKIVARGIDWLRGDCSNLMAVWDGHQVRSRKGAEGEWLVCGRILADSSWHHYVDYNIAAIAATGEGVWNDWAKLKALYVNIAAWLAPLAVRRAYRARACRWVGEHPDYAFRGTDRQMGATALPLLASRLPGAWLHNMSAELLAEHGAAKSVETMPADFGEVLIGGFMRRFMSGGTQEPLLQQVWQSPEERALKPDAPDLVTETIAAYEDEWRIEHKGWQNFCKVVQERR